MTYWTIHLRHWDPVWQPDRPSAHILVTLNAQMGPDGNPVPELATETEGIIALIAQLNAGTPDAVTLLEGHRGASPVGRSCRR